jgi:hypothetical protein
MACLLAGPGRFWLADEPEVSWPACAFGQRWNGWDSPRVDQRTLVLLVGHLLLRQRVTAFNLDRDGVMTVVDGDERVHRLTPDPRGDYDLVALDLVCHRSAERLTAAVIV